MVSLRPLPSKTELNEDALVHASKKDDCEHEIEEEDVTSTVSNAQVVRRLLRWGRHFLLIIVIS